MSCQENLSSDDMLQQSGIRLSVVNSSLSTKVPVVGDTSLNENKIRTIHYFVYPESTDQSVDNTERQPAIWGVVTAGEDTQIRQDFLIHISEGEMNGVIFPRPFNECDVYAIVNLPSEITIDNNTDKKLSSLKDIVLHADFVSKNVQDLFVMDGLSTVKLTSRTFVTIAEGVIDVERIAAKLSLTVNVDPEIAPWKSLPEEMVVEFYNGVSNATLSADPASVIPEYFDNQPSRTFVQSAGDWVCESFYTYPASWNIGADEEPYLKITLPWVSEVETESGQEFLKQYTYYKVILGGEQITSNTWYDMTVHLSVLGNFDDFEEIIVVEPADLTYRVIDWSSALSIDSEILEARYLVVENMSYELFNEENLKIPVSSSHDCEIVDFNTLEKRNQASITRPNYSQATVSQSTIAWSDTWTLQLVVDEENGNYIKFHHKMNNDLSTENIDFAQYTIKFRVRHIDDPDRYYRDVTIVQYPAMRIECKPNRKINNNGGVSVNESTSTYGGVHGLTGNNKNPNMYIIQTEVLPDGSAFIIGDPRSQTVNNLNNNSWASAKGIENPNGNDRKLVNYYPTLETEESENMIAPKFRIASSYGVTNEVTYTNAKNRCASYQEDGYPAGRWRLPTQAEIEYIVRLSSYKIIPELFTPNNNYWCANGTANPNANGGVTITENTTGNGPVRCVYDEWYWENTPYPRMLNTNVTFTWGDAKR